MHYALHVVIIGAMSLGCAALAHTPEAAPRPAPVARDYNKEMEAPEAYFNLERRGDRDVRIRINENNCKADRKTIKVGSNKIRIYECTWKAPPEAD